MSPQGGQSQDGLSFSLCSKLCLHISSSEYFVPPSKKNQSIHTLVFLLLEIYVFCKLYLGYLELGECQGQEAGVGGLIGSGSGEGIGGFQKGNQEKE